MKRPLFSPFIQKSGLPVNRHLDDNLDLEIVRVLRRRHTCAPFSSRSHSHVHADPASLTGNE